MKKWKIQEELNSEDNEDKKKKQGFEDNLK